MRTAPAALSGYWIVAAYSLAKLARDSNDNLHGRLEALSKARFDRLVAAVPFLVRLSEPE